MRNWYKCIDSLGHFVLSECLETSTPTVGAIRRLEYTTIVTEFQSFLGLYSYFWRFIPSFMYVAVLLNKKPRDGQPQNFDGLNEE